MDSIKLVSDTIDKTDINALIKWLSSDPIPQLTKGPLTKQLEEKWSQYLGVENTVYVNSGSSALLLMLSALKHTGRLKNSKVIVPGLSWVTDVSSCTQLDLKPILCDCNLGNLSVDLAHLEKLFKAEKPAAFLLVHVLGLVPSMDKIVKLCKQYDVLLLEDVCESMGSEYKGQKLGTFGVASVFSLYYGHHISTIEGGFICTNQRALAGAMLMMRNHGWDRDLNPSEQLHLRHTNKIDNFNAQYAFYFPGFNLRATDLQAFIGLRQVDKLDMIKERRQENFFQYNDYLIGNRLTLTVYDDDIVSNFAYPFVHPNRERIVKALQDNNVEVRPLIAGSMAKQPFWTKYYQPVELPNCELIHEQGFYLPNHQDLTTGDIQFICNIVNENV